LNAYEDKHKASNSQIRRFWKFPRSVCPPFWECSTNIHCKDDHLAIIIISNDESPDDGREEASTKRKGGGRKPPEKQTEGEEETSSTQESN